jgi:hypothetical protein
MISKYHHIFVDLGVPQLDVRRWDDGSWAIREFHRSPVVPSLTPWKYVLTGLKNIEISEGFIRKYLWQIDPRTKAFWQKDDDERKEEEGRRAYYENEKAERILQLGKQLAKNEGLMERAARIGPAAFDLENIGRKIYADQPWKCKNL